MICTNLASLSWSIVAEPEVVEAAGQGDLVRPEGGAFDGHGDAGHPRPPGRGLARPPLRPCGERPARELQPGEVERAVAAELIRECETITGHKAYVRVAKRLAPEAPPIPIVLDVAKV